MQEVQLRVNQNAMRRAAAAAAVLAEEVKAPRMASYMRYSHNDELSCTKIR